MENKYIQLLRRLQERLDENEHITDAQLVTLLEELNIDRGLHLPLKISLFDSDRQRNTRIEGQNAYLMTIDAYMKLLEYDELKEARADSKQARREAKVATRIAIAAIIINVFMAGWQIYLQYVTP